MYFLKSQTAILILSSFPVETITVLCTKRNILDKINTSRDILRNTEVVSGHVFNYYLFVILERFQKNSHSLYTCYITRNNGGEKRIPITSLRAELIQQFE